MKIKNNIIRTLSRLTQSNWIQPALLTVALVVAVLGATGCQPHH